MGGSTQKQGIPAQIGGGVWQPYTCKAGEEINQNRGTGGWQMLAFPVSFTVYLYIYFLSKAK